MSKQQSFIKGTFILICANAISKILGAVFKVPLTYLLREEGMAVYNTAFCAYSMLLSFIISGLPLALSKTIAEQVALKNMHAVRKTMAVSTLLLASLGILGSLLLWLGADFFAYSMKDAKAVFCIKVISPAVFFVALGTAYKSYYQGISNMLPTAISQVTEALIRLAAGFFLAYIFSNLATEYTAAAAIMGVTIGEIIATFILFVLYLPHHFSMPSGKCELSSAKIIKDLCRISIPVALAAVVSGAMNLADISVIRRCLENIQFTKNGAEHFLRFYSSYTSIFDDLPQTLSISRDGSRWLYGAYSGYALTIFHLPVGILSTLGISILPVVSGAIAVKNHKKASLCVGLSLKLTMLICLPSAFVLALFSEPVLNFVFGNTASAQMLAYLSPCLVFLSVSQMCCSVLNAGGSVTEPLLYGFLGEAVKLLCNVIFIKQQYINMLGTVISANISYFIVMLLSLCAVERKFGRCISVKDNFFKPLLSSVFMFSIMYSLYSPLTIVFSSEKLAFLSSSAVGMTAYILMLIFFGCITVDELKLLKIRPLPFFKKS